MTAQEIKSKWPLYPEVKFEDKEDGTVAATTIVRKNFDGRYYLIAARNAGDNQQAAKVNLDNSVDDLLKTYTLTAPDSEAAINGFALEVLDDNQD